MKMVGNDYLIGEKGQRIYFPKIKMQQSKIRYKQSLSK